MLSKALFIARADLGFMLRQRETLLWLFVMPGLFFYFIGTVTGGMARSSAGRPEPIALQAPADGGVVLDELVRRLEEQNYEVVRPATADAFARSDRRLTIPAPSSYPTMTESVLAGEQIVATFTRRGDQLAADFDRFRVSRAVYSVVADLAVLKSGGLPITSESFSLLRERPRQLTLSVRPAGRRAAAPSGFSQAVPGTMVMFTMLVLLTSGAITLVVEREHGLLRRLASAPISRGSIVLGKWTARMGLGIVQIGFAMIVGRVLFQVDWGSSLPMVVLVLLAWAALNASLAILLGSVARTQAQMAGIGVVATMALAALGGCWWPIEIAPSWMQAVAMGLPSGWTMDAMHRLVSFGDPAAAAVPHVLALAASAMVAGWAGTRAFRYQ